MAADPPFVRRLYDASPVWLQNLMVTVEGYRKKRERYGPHFARWREFFAESFAWSRERLEAYQDEQLRQVVRCAWEHVPFYRRRFEALGLTPDDVTTVRDLPKLPLLEKADLRAAGRGLLADNVPEADLHVSRTGGSTGTPLTIYSSGEALERMYGFFWARDRIGLEFGMPYAAFGANLVVPPSRTRPPFWRENRAARQTLYSVYHLSPETLEAYVANLATRRFEYYEGYATPLVLLARHLLAHPRPFAKYPRAVFCTSEELQPLFRETIERAFQTRVFNQYGQDEKVTCITEYACGHMHYDMDFGIIEFLPVGRTEDGRPLAEMVCTGFQNFAAPLLRYRVGDLAVPADEGVRCDAHAGPVVESILGRTGHVLIDKRGRLFHNITAIARDCRNIEMMQCIQCEPGAVEVRVARGPDYTADDERILRDQFARRMDKMEFQVVYVDGPEQFERTRLGKFLSIVSRIPPGKVPRPRISG